MRQHEWRPYCMESRLSKKCYCNQFNLTCPSYKIYYKMFSSDDISSGDEVFGSDNDLDYISEVDAEYILK